MMILYIIIYLQLLTNKLECIIYTFKFFIIININKLIIIIKHNNNLIIKNNIFYNLWVHNCLRRLRRCNCLYDQTYIQFMSLAPQG